MYLLVVVFAYVEALAESLGSDVDQLGLGVVGLCEDAKRRGPIGSTRHVARRGLRGEEAALCKRDRRRAEEQTRLRVCISSVSKALS